MSLFSVASLFRRLGSRPEAPSRPSVAARGAIGEWLWSVRLPQEDGESLARSRRQETTHAYAFPEPRGDLTRTHVMRLKRERGHLEDGITRDTRSYR